jgi:hypothetical protein
MEGETRQLAKLHALEHFMQDWDGSRALMIGAGPSVRSTRKPHLLEAMNLPIKTPFPCGTIE